MHNNSLCTAANAEAVLSFLRDRGILEDDGATPQQVEEKKRKQAYHNTLLLLTNYRSILWQTESELESVAAGISGTRPNILSLWEAAYEGSKEAVDSAAESCFVSGVVQYSLLLGIYPQFLDGANNS